MQEKLVLIIGSLLSIGWMATNKRITPPPPVMIIESFGTIPAAERILPEDTLRFHLPDSIGYSDELEIVNPFWIQKKPS